MNMVHGIILFDLSRSNITYAETFYLDDHTATNHQKLTKLTRGL